MNSNLINITPNIKYIIHLIELNVSFGMRQTISKQLVVFSRLTMFEHAYVSFPVKCQQTCRPRLNVIFLKQQILVFFKQLFEKCIFLVREQFHGFLTL